MTTGDFLELSLLGAGAVLCILGFFAGKQR